MPSRKKSPAEDRTVGLFTGRTAEEEAAEAARIKAEEDIQASKEERTPMAEAVDTWRSNAFQCQEWTSKYFPKPGTPTPLEDAAKNAPNSRQYRLSAHGPDLYLEKAGIREGEMFSYAGIMFPLEDVFELSILFTKAAKAMLGK